MALNRAPTAIQVNGAALLVRDPEVTAGLFTKYQRVPGFASFTLPDETGSTNETQLMDGSVAFAQIAGVGTISGSIGALTGHATHRFLAGKRRGGGNVTVTIVRPAVTIIDGKGMGASNAADTHPPGSTTALIVAANGTAYTLPASAVVQIREGHIIGLDAGKTGAQAGTMEGYIGYDVDDDDVAATDDKKYRSVLRVNAGASATKIEVEVKHVTGIPAQSTSNTENRFDVRSPGFIYQDIICTVNGFGDGDFQAGGALASNLSLQPAAALPTGAVETRLLSEFGTSFDGVFTDIS